MNLELKDLVISCEACKALNAPGFRESGLYGTTNGIPGMQAMVTSDECPHCGGARKVLTPLGKVLRQFTEMLKDSRLR